MAMYAKAAGQVEPTAAEMAELKAVEAATRSNLAICFVKLGDGPKALEQCGQVLAKDPAHGKALFTKGRALLLVKDLDGAKEALAAAAAVSPDDPAIKKELAQLPKLEAKARAKEKATWQKAMSKF